MTVGKLRGMVLLGSGGSGRQWRRGLFRRDPLQVKLDVMGGK